jgi:hypothetical protein
VREVTTKYREVEAATITKLGRLWGPKHANSITTKGDGYENEFRARLEHYLVDILPLDSVTHDELIARALARRRPFDDSGRVGYRDALIWHNVLEAARHEDVALVTRDKGFGEKGRLHAHLQEDLAQRGLSRSRVSLFHSIEDVVRTLFKPVDELVTNLRELLVGDSSFHQSLVEQLQDAARMGGGYVDPNFSIDLDAGAEQWDQWVQDFDLVDFSNFRNVRIERAFPGADDAYSIEISINADAEFRVEISTDAWRVRPPLSPYEYELSVNEDAFYAGGWADVTLEFWSRYSRTDGSFLHHELTSTTQR